MRIYELEKSVSELTGAAKIATDRANASEIESGTAKKQAEDLKAQLLAVRSDAEIIAEYKASQDYSEAVADVVAAKLLRCWLIAERLVKTNPEPTWDKFTDAYVKAESAFDADRTEPQPYDGPGLIIAPAVQITNPDDQGQS